jgi:hypothetical protein
VTLVALTPVRVVFFRNRPTTHGLVNYPAIIGVIAWIRVGPWAKVGKHAEIRRVWIHDPDR